VGGVIPGWTEALQLMREGDKWEITIPPELAFGSRGPLGNQTLIYEIELLEVSGQEQSTTAKTASSENS
jgi:FKBP-type peptidyl-prolyl cis-trans isomerase